ncbi:hypothetical protein ACOI8O_04490 [Bifidobacterium adolescentis]|uniref:hypothetical protein n=1 Tax=Bifidobacterium adolescentis TaxID=1680 RepID=UPI003CFF4E76
MNTFIRSHTVFFFSDGHPNLWDDPDGDGTLPESSNYDNIEEGAYSQTLGTAKQFNQSYGDHIQNFTSLGLQRDSQDLSKLEKLSTNVFGTRRTAPSSVRTARRSPAIWSRTSRRS